MDEISIPEIPINSSLKHTFFPASSSPLSSPPVSKLPDIITQIEENIKEDKNKKKTDGEREINNIKNNNTRRRKITQKHIRL